MMIGLRDTIEIKASPEEILDWFRSLDKNYRDWHPKDHLKCVYLKRSPMEPDSIIYFEEYLHGELEKMKLHIKEVEPNSRVEYRVLFPYSLLGMRGAFIIEPRKAGSFFTAEVYLGPKTPLLGRLMDKLTRIFFGSRLEALKEHMFEERSESQENPREGRRMKRDFGSRDSMQKRRKPRVSSMYIDSPFEPLQKRGLFERSGKKREVEV